MGDDNIKKSVGNDPEDTKKVKEDDYDIMDNIHFVEEESHESGADSGKYKKKGKTKRKKRGWIIAGGIMSFVALAYVGVSVFFMSHFFINTEINGYDSSGKTVPEVESYMKEQVSDYRLTILERNNKSDTISGNQIDLKYKPNEDIKKELEKQNAFLWPASLFTPNSIKIALNVSYNEAGLNEQIQKLKAVTAEQIPAKSAYPKYDGDQFVVEPEVVGTSVDMDVLKEKVATTISQFGTKLDMEAEKCYTYPKYTTQSPEVKAASDTMNSYAKASITYTMREPVVVDKALISTWLKVNDDMNVVFDEGAVKAWLTQFGNTHDTLQTTRTITSPTGKTVQVSGGTYGWSINEDQEFQALIDSIKKGETVSREPAYYQTAAVHGPADWGNSYVEVDLSTQYMWIISNGAVVMETPVVTGVPIPEKITPTGVYSILELQRNKTLVGAIDPKTGKPEYETPVSFWMRVTWSGIGFHDATWQPEFGGSLYTVRGSHGCINMPYGKAQSLYDMLAIGTPVIIHN